MTSPNYYWRIGVSAGQIRKSIDADFSLGDMQYILDRLNVKRYPSRFPARVVVDPRPGVDLQYVEVGYMAWGAGKKAVWEYQGLGDLDLRALGLVATRYMRDLRGLPRGVSYDLKPESRPYKLGFRRYAKVARFLEDGEEWWSLEEALSDVLPRSLVMQLESLTAGGDLS